MAAAHKIYRRLTRNVAEVGTYASLWQGPDHLLIVTSSGFSESYSRVQFRDVKGFFIVRTARRAWWALVWFLLAVIPAIVLGNSLADGEPFFISGGFLLILLAIILWNHVLGCGCRVVVVTAVQNARLPALVRVKKARKVLGRLQPLIEAAQADIAPPHPISTAEPAVPLA